MAEVASRTTISSLKSQPIIKGKLQASNTIIRTTFDPDKHLNFVDEPTVLSLKDIGLPEDAGISPVAVSQPFPLFNEEAIRIMREEIFTNEVWDDYLHSTDDFGCQLRGYCPK